MAGTKHPPPHTHSTAGLSQVFSQDRVERTHFKQVREDEINSDLLLRQHSTLLLCLMTVAVARAIV